MKKSLVRTVSVLLCLVIGTGLLSGCNANSPAYGDGLVTLRIGATPVPHAEILQYIRPFLLEEGIYLNIVEFTEFPLVNPALYEGQLDANYFQHVPFLNSFINNTGNQLHIVGPIHIEPMGAYSTVINDISELPVGGRVAIPNDATNGGRALMLLDYHGLISLDPAAGILATVEDIIYNPLELQFYALDAAMLPRILMDGETELAVVNTNHILAGTNLNPLRDSLIIEDPEGNPFANVLVVRPEDAQNEAVLTLFRHLQSDRVRQFILENYDGVVPVF